MVCDAILANHKCQEAADKSDDTDEVCMLFHFHKPFCNRHATRTSLAQLVSVDILSQQFLRTV